MSLSKTVVQEYMSRKFRDLAKTWKALPRSRLNEILAQLQPQPEFVRNPFDHQLACFLLGLKYPGLFFGLDMGTGKSKLVLDIFSYRCRLKSPEQRARRMLVLVPNRINVWAWEDQIREHAPQLRYGLLSDKTGRVRREQIWRDQSLQVVVSTYAGMVSLHKDRSSNSKSAANSKKKKRVPINAKLVERTGSLFDTVVADESAEMRNPDTDAARILLQLGHLVRFRYPMTGTPFTKDALGLWSQLQFADPQENPLSCEFGLYRSLFFTPIKVTFGTEYVLSTDKRELLHRVLRHQSIRYSEDECNSLPEKMGGIINPICIPVKLSDSQADYTQQTYLEMREMMDQGQQVGAYVRMRRAASGYYRIPGSDIYQNFEDNPKLDACVELLREMGDDQCVVAVYYQESVKILEDRFREEQANFSKTKISFTCSKIIGGQSNSSENDAAFRSGKSRILILSTAGCRGINLQHCNKMIIFESPVRMDDAVQMEKRIHRTNQTRKVMIYHLVAPIDLKILESLRTNKHVLDCVMDGTSSVV